MTEDIVVAQGKHFHSACALVRTPARDCLAFVADGATLSLWLADQPEVTPLGDRLFAIVYTGAHVGAGPEKMFVKVAPEGGNTVYFHIGVDPDQLQKRILIAIYEAPETSVASGGCMVNLMGWRMDSMSDRRWRELRLRHEREIKTLQRLLDRPGGNPAPERAAGSKGRDGKIS